MNNSLNGTSVTTAQLLMNNDSNYSNFTFKNSTTSNTKYSHLQTRNFNSNNSLSHTDSLENINYNVDNNNSNSNTSNPYNHYIKLTNDDIISKIKLKLTASTQNILSNNNNNNNNNKSQIANDKEHNNISFENENAIQTPTKQQSNTKPKHRKPTNQVIQKQHNKQQFNNSINNNNNSKCFISSASKTKDLSQFVNSDYMYIKNALGNSPVASSTSSSSAVIKENGCLFSNRTLSGKRHKKKHKISNSIDIKSNNKSHLNELSITTESTFSSKRNYRNKSNQNRLHSKHTNETTPNEDTEAKERTKIFYKNIKNIKSKYNSFINSNGSNNNNNTNNTHLLSSNEPSKFASNTNEKYFQMKGLHLEQYINTKLN